MEQEPHTDERDIIEQLNEGIALLEAGRDDDAEAFEILSHLSDYFDGAVPADLHEDAILKLEQAICLPELNGSYTVNPELRTPSESVSIKTLRRAISDGHLAVLRPNSKNLFTTPRAVKEWLINCRDLVNLPTSFSERNDVTLKGGSRTKRHISSKTETSSLSRDAVLNSLKMLKGS